MPLSPGNSNKIKSKNISEMIRAGYPHKQAIAAALANARRHPKKLATGGSTTPNNDYQKALQKLGYTGTFGGGAAAKFSQENPEIAAKARAMVSSPGAAPATPLTVTGMIGKQSNDALGHPTNLFTGSDGKQYTYDQLIKAGGSMRQTGGQYSGWMGGLDSSKLPGSNATMQPATPIASPPGASGPGGGTVAPPPGATPGGGAPFGAPGAGSPASFYRAVQAIQPFMSPGIGDNPYLQAAASLYARPDARTVGAQAARDAGYKGGWGIGGQDAWLAQATPEQRAQYEGGIQAGGGQWDQPLNPPKIYNPFYGQPQMAKGGGIPSMGGAGHRAYHPHGLFATDGKGRTDNINTHVPAGAYVLPADIVSGLGDGNTLAGGKILDTLFPHKGDRYATGGAVPVVVAGGEYLIGPDVIKKKWGDLKTGHRVLDAFVKHTRGKTANKLKKLPGPKQ